LDRGIEEINQVHFNARCGPLRRNQPIKVMVDEKRIEIRDRSGRMENTAQLPRLLVIAVKKAEALGFSIWFVGPHPYVLPDLLKGHGFKLLGFEAASVKNPRGQSFWVKSPDFN